MDDSSQQFNSENPNQFTGGAVVTPTVPDVTPVSEPSYSPFVDHQPAPTATTEVPQPLSAPHGLHHMRHQSRPAPVSPPAEMPPAAPNQLNDSVPPTAPVPVVRVLSPLGVEYVFMTVALFTAAIGLTAALLSLVNGVTSFSVLSVPTALLVVGIPVFALLFLHVKRLEVQQPALRLDASKRRSTQFTQIVSFVVCLFTLIGVVGTILAKLGGQGSMAVSKVLLDGLVLLVVFGGLLAYYWRDEHQNH